MKRPKKGFTLIEVALFLAITGALFVSVTVGVQNSIYQQRFNDSVQSFAEFLRNIYAGVMNVESDIIENGGRSNKAIYGKLVTFGESSNLEGVSTSSNENGNRIYVYNIIGDAEALNNDKASSSALDALISVNANVVMPEDGRLSPVGIVESYIPKWTSRIEPPCNQTNNECPSEPFKGALLIVRNPQSGTVNTFSLQGTTIEVSQAIQRVDDAYQAARAAELAATTEQEKAEAKNRIQNLASGRVENILKEYLEPGQPNRFKIENVDFCINPEMDMPDRFRRDVRIVEGAANASSIEIIDEGINNKCEIQG